LIVEYLPAGRQVENYGKLVIGGKMMVKEVFKVYEAYEVYSHISQNTISFKTSFTLSVPLGV